MNAVLVKFDAAVDRMAEMGVDSPPLMPIGCPSDVHGVTDAYCPAGAAHLTIAP